MRKYTVADLPDEALPPLEELVGDMRILADMVGVRKAMEISEAFGVTPARLYGHYTILLRYRNKRMRAEYDEGNIAVIDLARKYGLGERQTYNILGFEPGEERQLRLF